VISTEDEDRCIRLPLGAVGASVPSETEDIFDRELSFDRCDKHSVYMKVGAHQSYLFRCSIG